MIDRCGGFDGDPAAFFLAGTRRGRGGFGFDPAAFFLAGLFGGGGGDDGEAGALFLARAFDRGGGGGFGGHQRAFLFAGALGGGRGFRLQASNVGDALALGRFRFGFGFLAAQRLMKGALGGGLGFGPQTLRFEPVFFRFAAKRSSARSLRLALQAFGVRRAAATSASTASRRSRSASALLAFGALVAAALRGLSPSRLERRHWCGFGRRRCGAVVGADFTPNSGRPGRVVA